MFTLCFMFHRALCRREATELTQTEANVSMEQTVRLRLDPKSSSPSSEMTQCSVFDAFVCSTVCVVEVVYSAAVCTNQAEQK